MSLSRDQIRRIRQHVSNVFIGEFRGIIINNDLATFASFDSLGYQSITITIVFVGLWLGSARLFQQAGRN